MASQKSVKNQTTPQLEALAGLQKASGDSLRLAILRLLATNSYGVLELSEIFDTKQSGMSHHLKVLASAALVATRKEGNSVFYRRAPILPSDTLAPIKRALFETVDNSTLPESVKTGIQAVHSERALASQRFFIENAKKFREQQDLIALDDVYSEQVAQVLDQAHLPSRAHALEIGPGEGHFLKVLSERFEQVDGLDNSGSMLDEAASFIHSENLRNVNLQLGDAAQIEPIPRYDCVAMNMVLHHTPSPADIFLSVGHAIEPGGILIVCDLCEHDQAWVKEACGDIWQGFQARDLDQWALEAGLQEKQSVFFALRNGFQIQIKQFQKQTTFT